MEKSVCNYVRENWRNVIRSGKSKAGIDLPYPFTVFAKLLDKQDDAKAFREKTNQRKAFMEKYLMDESGVFHDYDFVNGVRSQYVCAAGMLPFVMGVSVDKNACLQTLCKLEGEFGFSAGENIQTNISYQWAYPNIWPSLLYWAYNALYKLGLIDDANRLRKKYMFTIERNFVGTGKLWEKYNSQTGEVSHTEYQSPPMMGWTAGLYAFLCEKGDI